MSKTEKRDILSKVALGNIPPDTIITNGILFNVFTREFIKKQSIWIKDGMIAYAGDDHDPARDGKTEVIDAEGMVLLPGLIDANAPPISNRSGVEEFVKHVIPSGVTTVITETVGCAATVGKDSVEYVPEGFEGQPIRFYYTVPLQGNLTRSEEVNAPSNKEPSPYLQDQASTEFGVSSCPDSMDEKEVLQRLRLGYTVMIIEGSIRKELERVKEIFKKKIEFRKLVLATDGVDPKGFLAEGYLDASLKRALKLGVLPRLAYQMVTINVAEHFRLDHLIGSLSPGRMADLLTIPSPKVFSPQWVMCGGRMIYKDGVSLAEPQGVLFPTPHHFKQSSSVGQEED